MLVLLFDPVGLVLTAGVFLTGVCTIELGRPSFRLGYLELYIAVIYA